MDGVRILNNELKNCFEKRVQLSQERKNEAINFRNQLRKRLLIMCARAMIDFLLFLELVQVVIMKKHKLIRSLKSLT